jgi:hypothetical protein
MQNKDITFKKGDRAVFIKSNLGDGYGSLIKCEIMFPCHGEYIKVLDQDFKEVWVPKEHLTHDIQYLRDKSLKDLGI